MKKGVMYVSIISAAIIVTGVAAFLLYSNHTSITGSQQTIQDTQKNHTAQISIQGLEKFNSTDEMQKFLLDLQTRQNIQGSFSPLEEQLGLARQVFRTTTTAPTSTPAQGGVAVDSGTFQSNAKTPTVSPANVYSTTNVQVAGIDEPDFIKNDGKYAYILSQDKISIIDAYPGETAKLVSKVGLDVKGNYLQNMFLNKDRLVIFYNDNQEQYSINRYDYIPTPNYLPVTHAVIIDVSDKENPRILHNYELTGYYAGARMIGSHVYLISNTSVDYVHPMPPILRGVASGPITSDVYYFDNPEPNYNFNTITTFDIFSNEINSKTFLMGATGTLYVSNDAIYLTYQKYQPYYYDQSYAKDRFFNVILPLLPEELQAQIKSIDASNIEQSQKWIQISDLMQNTYNKMSEGDKSKLFDKIQQALTQYDSKIQQDYRKTIIQKFAINNGTITYVGKGEVQGYLLNQYSMDEYGDRFRVATTTEYYTSKGTVTANNVYVLDESLNVVGSLDKVAPDESIYSARFMGDKLYLVTYQRVDPFFVIDLASDTPKILGALKIPGYSSYLHPYDKTHIIGIGKETKQNQYGGMEPLGVKISLFDVSNMTNPITVGTYLIGSQSTDSEVLSEPKALLFDKEKNILSIPVFQAYGGPIPLNLTENYSEAKGESPSIMPPRPITNNWRGFYIFGVDPNNGFTLKGVVEHESTDSGYYFGNSRSFYIDNSLYTVTPGIIKINDLNDIKKEINKIKIDNTGQIIKNLK
jgi:inhibitor of cysteine peptidase